MTTCTCGRSRVVFQNAAQGNSPGEVYCESFEVCPEEQRTGISNARWFEFLGPGRLPPTGPQSVPWPLTSGLIELKGVRAAVEKRRAEEVPKGAPLAPIVFPSVVLPSGEQSAPSSRSWAVAAMAFAFVVGLLGAYGYREARSRTSGGDAFGRGPDIVGPTLGAALPYLPLDGASKVAANEAVSPDDYSGGAALADPQGDTLAPTAASARDRASREGVSESSPRTSPAGKVAIRRTRGERRARHSDGDRASRNAASAKDRAAAPAADSLYDALAKASAASAALSPQVLPDFQGRQVAPDPSSGSAALAASLAGPGSSGGSGAKAKPAVTGVDRLLNQAAVDAPRAEALVVADVPEVPERLGTVAVGRLSVQVAAKVRECARQFGFLRVSLSARLRVTGATGRISSLSLSDRFAGSPVEGCTRRAVSSLKVPSFRTASQNLSVPVVVH